MRPLRPLELIGLGFALAALGVLIPALTVLRVLEAGFGLLFLAQAASVAGLLLGLVGASRFERP